MKFAYKKFHPFEEYNLMNFEKYIQFGDYRLNQDTEYQYRCKILHSNLYQFFLLLHPPLSLQPEFCLALFGIE